MNKFCGYVAFRYNEEKDWFCKEYLIIRDDNKVAWTEDPNAAMIFPTIEHIESIYPVNLPKLSYRKIMMIEVDV